MEQAEKAHTHTQKLFLATCRCNVSVGERESKEEKLTDKYLQVNQFGFLLE
jgi:hypothetical protein